MFGEESDLMELERDPETIYLGIRGAELESAFLNENGELEKHYHPQVFVEEPDGQKFPLLPRREESNSHPDSNFEWGYRGNGPHLLAYSLLADAYGPEEFESTHYDRAVNYVSQLDRNQDWALKAKELDDFIQDVE
jgi:hypothetical protein